MHWQCCKHKCFDAHNVSWHRKISLFSEGGGGVGLKGSEERICTYIYLCIACKLAGDCGPMLGGTRAWEPRGYGTLV